MFSFSLFHSMEEQEPQRKLSASSLNTPPLHIVTTTFNSDGRAIEEESSSSLNDVELTDQQIADMLFEKFKDQFSDHPEIASQVNKLAADLCGKRDDVKEVLRRTRDSPRYNEHEYKQKMDELQLEVLKQGIINMQEENKREQQRLAHDKRTARATLRLGYSNLIISGMIGFVTASIATATFIALLTTGCSE